VPVEHLPENPFSGSASDLHVQRQAPGQFGDTMIQERRPGFQAHPHRGAIDLVQDVIGQIR
jgi:hypothetical protein